MIRLILVDDQTLVRAGIHGLLELNEDIRVVAQAADGQEAVELIARERPDLVLLDVRLPKLSGIGVIQALAARKCLPPVLLLTTFDDDEALFDGMRAGAKGFLLKDISPERLADAVRRVARGESLFQPAITQRAKDMSAETSAAAADGLPSEVLTRREGEILRLMAGGWSNKEIARALGTSEGTIKNHVSSILAKLGVRDRTRAVLKAMSEGLL